MKDNPESNSKDLLDPLKSKDFLLDILKGDQNKFALLEQWYNQENISHKMTKSNTALFNLILDAYNYSKNNNYNIERIKKENEELKMSADLSSFDNIYINAIENLRKENEDNQNLFIMKINEIQKNIEEMKNNHKIEITNLENKIDGMKIKNINLEKKYDEIKKDNNNLEKKIDGMKNENFKQKKQINDMENKFNINTYFQNIDGLKLLINECILKLKINYMDNMGNINKIKISQLISVVNDLFSFRNIFIYRKFIHIVLKRIIEIYKDYMEISNIKGKDKIVVKKNFHKSTALTFLLNFFFFVKKKANSIIHITNIIDLIKDLKSKSSLDINEINSIKDSNTMFNDLKKNCTYKAIIETFNLKMPLIFF